MCFANRAGAVCLLLLTALVTRLPAAEVTFRVACDADLRQALADNKLSGRLVVYLLHPGSRVGEAEPAEGPFWFDPQPLFGKYVTDHDPARPMTLGPDVVFPDAFPVSLTDLPAGVYTAQAVLDRSRIESSWRREPGNLVGEPVRIEMPEEGEATFELPLNRMTQEREFPQHPMLKEVSVESRLLSEFRDEKVVLKAGVLEPINFDPQKRYAVLYDIPGFGGRHTGVAQYLFRLGGDWAELRKRAFIVVLDPESPNGHTLFCDSRVNGPCGQALVEELIPAIEKRFSAMIPEPWARMVTGHSSGGWSSLWLGLTYPDTFGAVWSSAPDPVDFRRFELVDIYGQENAYRDGEGNEIPSCRYTVGDDEAYEVTLTIRGENGGEGVLGPSNTSGQQFDSWMACWGTPDPSNPRVAKPLFDAETGVLDHEEAKAYEPYDIRLKLAREPATYVPLFHEHIRLICGEMDNYYLNEAVTLLKQELDRHTFQPWVATPGYIKLIPHADHGRSLFQSEAMQAWPSEMLKHLQQNGLD